MRFMVSTMVGFPAGVKSLDGMSQYTRSTRRRGHAASDHAGLDRFHLAGHSLGAVVAAAVAGTRPDRVLSLAAHAGWAKTDPWMAFQMDLWIRLARIDGELLARLLQVTAMSGATLRGRSEEDFRAAAAGFTAALAGMEEGFIRQSECNISVDITALLPRITAPALIVSSTEDRIVPPHHQRELARLIPGARLTEVPGGHGLPFEDPALFTGVLSEFLDAQREAAAGRVPHTAGGLGGVMPGPTPTSRR
ncbi:hypothetical protein GCM10010151_18920 [Actinoallomurus spadix]|uniref:AB hydrolase-1 domain-containing protein n=2 Tax=Actinoallomurus spadix TaxID=79912 RepID=A0ABP3FZ90_9ACTN